MRAPAKLAAFAAVLAIVTGGGAVVGAAAGPIDVGDDDHDVHPGTEAAAEPADAAEVGRNCPEAWRSRRPATGSTSTVPRWPPASPPSSGSGCSTRAACP